MTLVHVYNISILFVLWFIHSAPPELGLSLYGLSTESSNQFNVEGIIGTNQTRLTTTELVNTLEEIYCGPIAVEYDHVQVHVYIEFF